MALELLEQQLIRKYFGAGSRELATGVVAASAALTSLATGSSPSHSAAPASRAPDNNLSMHAAGTLRFFSMFEPKQARTDPLIAAGLKKD